MRPPRFASAWPWPMGSWAVCRRPEPSLSWAAASGAHLDQVLGLGGFVELEVVLDGAVVDAARGEALIGEAMAALGIRREDLLSGAYLELLMAG